MIKGKYGNFTEKQFEEHKVILHKKVHWLLIYKEKDYDYDVILNYFDTVLRYISSLNEIFEYDPLVISLLIKLQETLDEFKKKDCNFKLFRKNIFEAHNIIDKLGGGRQHDNSAELPKDIG